MIKRVILPTAVAGSILLSACGPTVEDSDLTATVTRCWNDEGVEKAEVSISNAGNVSARIAEANVVLTGPGGSVQENVSVLDLGPGATKSATAVPIGFTAREAFPPDTEVPPTCRISDVWLPIGE